MTSLIAKAALTKFLMKGGGSKSKQKKEPELPMPDEEELRRKSRKRMAEQAQRGGRVSTILDDEETLG